MFGGPPPSPSEAELNAGRDQANGIIKNALGVAALLWAAPFAIELIKGRF